MEHDNQEGFYRKYLELHKTKKISIERRREYANAFPTYNIYKRYTAIVIGVKRGGEKHAVDVISVKWFHEVNYLIDRFPLTLDMIHGKAYGPLAALVIRRSCRVEKLAPAYRGMVSPPRNKWTAVSGIKSIDQARKYINDNKYWEMANAARGKRCDYRIRMLENPVNEIVWWD